MTDLPSAFLVLPKPGDKSLLAIQRKVRMLALRRLLAHPTHELNAPTARGLRSLRRALTSAVRTKPALVLDAIGNPDVICPLLVLEVGIPGQNTDALIRQAVVSLLATLHHFRGRGALPESVLWDVPLDEIMDCRGGRVLAFSPTAKALLATPSGLEVQLADGTKHVVGDAYQELNHEQAVTSRPFYPIHRNFPRLHISTLDSNPLSMYEAHPDKEGNAISLGDQPASRWVELYREALALIELGAPTWYDEIKTSMQRLVPVGYMPERHESATYREAPGVAYVTLCDNPLTLAEAMIHETQHSKINQLSLLDPIVHNAHTFWTDSPVRPDLRPLWGVLLAVHAFVPVSAMHHRLLELDHPITHSERFPRRQAEVLAGNHHGLRAVVDNADATVVGLRLIDEMNALHQHLKSVAPQAPGPVDDDILPPS